MEAIASVWWLCVSGCLFTHALHVLCDTAHVLHDAARVLCDAARSICLNLSRSTQCSCNYSALPHGSG
jgi:hypothetical protein